MATGRSSHPPSFFKVIQYPSAPHLSLPIAFVRKYKNVIPKEPKLVTATREHSWSLKIVKIGKDYCFSHGWEKLAKDVKLCIRDMVVFSLIDHSTFQVTILGENGCEKIIKIPSFVKSHKTNFADDGVKDDGQDDDDDEVMKENNLSFSKVFSSKTYKYTLSLPMVFVKAAGLEYENSLRLKDHEGGEWTMKIVKERYPRRYNLSIGWANFRRYHRLSDGDECIFTFDKNESVLNLTQVLRSERSVRQETPMQEVNTNNGKPSCYSGVNLKTEDEWSPFKKPWVVMWPTGGEK